MQTSEEDSEVMDSEGNETVYDNQTDDSHVMSERVQNLASSIYTEFERLIKAYDEDVVKDLMPLVVGILEGLDNVLLDKQEKEVDLELLKDDNEQLITQYEREKQLRKASEQKLLELDDMREEEMKEMESKVESMESLLRMFELKAKNSQDHIARLEDKESEMRKEYTKLHDRYTELFKTHVDHMERTKMLMGGERIMEMGSNALPRGQGGFQTPSLRPVNASLGLYPTADAASIVDTPTTDTPPTLDTPQADTSNMSLHNEFQQQAEASAETDDAAKALKTKEEKDSHNKSSIQADNKIHEHTSADLVASTPELETFDEQYSGPSAHTTDNSAPASRNENSLFTEIRHDDSSDVGNMLDITGKVIHPGEYSSAVSDNFFGVGKEVENLILENTELLTTKNALNIVKDDLIAKVDELQSEQEIQREEIASLQAMKSRLKARVTELEEDLKKTKDDLEKQKELAKNQPQDEDDVPLAQRKRFTRVEMARVLMERNQYKERLMELQEAVRYTEMIRASREHPELATKKKGSIWNFFGNLFMTPNKPQKKQLPSATIKYSAASTNVRPVGDPNKKNRDKLIGDKGKAYNFLQDDALADKCRREREQERREQYKQVRAHVKKDDGRMQAYGWSLPAKFPTSSQSSSSPNNSGSSDGSKQRTDTRGSHVPVPVPVYCHPLLSREPGIKIWCAAGVNLSGGVTKDGGSVVGASVFYSNNSPTEKMDNDKPGVTSTKDSVERLNQELKDHESNMSPCSSSLVWICTTSQNHNSNMLIIDANKPSQILESFTAGNSHILCVASVPGATADDYTSSRSKSLLDDMEMEIEDLDNMSPSSSPPKSSGPVDLDNIKVVQCATGGEGGASGGGEGGATGGGAEDTNRVEGSTSRVEGGTSGEEGGTSSSSPPSSAGTSAASEAANTSKDGNDNSNETSEPSVKHVRNAKPIHDTTSSSGSTDAHITSVAPTMWLGSQSGSLYVHPAAHHWKTCLHSVKLNDSILSITHANGRVIVALANSTMVVFHRDSDGIWDLSSYYVVDLGRPQHSVRCLCVIGNKQVWCGRRNKIHVLDPNSLQIQKSFSAHPRKESQIRQLAWIGDGVWVSIRLDSTLRLYHAYTHHHLQDVDIEPYVSKMLGTGKLGFSFVRITSLMVSCSRLWIGTGNGVIISVPLSESNKQTVTGTTTGRPGGIIRVYSDTKTGAVTPGSFIPYCSMAQAQLSFHGHKDAVKFFVAVAGSPPKSLTSTASTSANNNSSSPTTDTPPPASASGGTSASSSPAHTASSSAATTASSMLLMSGGEGYVDFRIGDIEDDSDGLTGDEKPSGSLSKGDRSHLIVWSLACR